MSALRSSLRLPQGKQSKLAPTAATISLRVNTSRFQADKSHEISAFYHMNDKKRHKTRKKPLLPAFPTSIPILAWTDLEHPNVGTPPPVRLHQCQSPMHILPEYLAKIELLADRSPKSAVNHKIFTAVRDFIPYSIAIG